MAYEKGEGKMVPINPKWRLDGKYGRKRGKEKETSTTRDPTLVHPTLASDATAK